MDAIITSYRQLVPLLPFMTHVDMSRLCLCFNFSALGIYLGTYVSRLPDIKEGNVMVFPKIDCGLLILITFNDYFNFKKMI